MKNGIKRAIAGISALALVTVGATGCTSSANKSSKQATKEQAAIQQVKNDNEKKLDAAEPFPSNKLNSSAERANLAERLLRTNQPHKVGYLYILNNLGSPIGYYVVKGKVSSINSEMTNSEQLVQCGHYSYDRCVIEAQDDDGSYGPSEGGDNGIFFFTESDVLVETDQGWIYSDAPLNLKVPLLVTRDATPTSTGGHKH